MAWLEKLMGNKPGLPVMVVDDESDIRKLLSIHLNHLGLEVTAVSTAEKAEELLEQGERFRLFIVDVNMPGQNGIELAKKIRERPSAQEVPIIVLTGVMTNEGQMRLEHDIPNLICLGKPFDSKKLRELVKDILLPEQNQDKKAAKPPTA